MIEARAIEVLETERLRGERIAPAHAGALAPMLADPRVGATLGGTLTEEETAASVARQARHWEHNGFGYWVWFERSTGRPIARGGLQRTRVGERDEVEVGWAVVGDRWGEGFATELGAAAVGAGFERLGLRDIVAFALPENRRSRGVMEKLGFEYEREVVHVGLPHVLYRLWPAP